MFTKTFMSVRDLFTYQSKNHYLILLISILFYIINGKIIFNIFENDFRVEADGRKYVRYEVIGHNHVAVPTHFYKIVVGETNDSKLEMEAFVMPNKPIEDNAPLTAFQVMISNIKNYISNFFTLSESWFTNVVFTLFRSHRKALNELRGFYFLINCLKTNFIKSMEKKCKHFNFRLNSQLLR